jgi:S2P endopeptidase
MSQLTGEHSILRHLSSFVTQRASSDDDRCCTNLTNMNASDRSSSLSCFVSFENAAETYCTDAVAILSKIQNRCDSSALCLTSQSCIEPRGDRDLLRITVRHQGTKDERVVLWSGPKYEVWEQGMALESAIIMNIQFRSSVQTTHFAPRFGILPLGLPLSLADFFQYVPSTDSHCVIDFLAGI